MITFVQVICTSFVFAGNVRWFYVFLQMKEARHENVNIFLGAVVEGDNMCLLMNLCQRGALCDVLENDDLQLDLMFKMSFAMDVINVCNVDIIIVRLLTYCG